MARLTSLSAAMALGLLSLGPPGTALGTVLGTALGPSPVTVPGAGAGLGVGVGDTLGMNSAPSHHILLPGAPAAALGGAEPEPSGGTLKAGLVPAEGRVAEGDKVLGLGLPFKAPGSPA